MTASLALARMGRLVAEAHGWDLARAFKTYEPSAADQAVIAGCAQDMLRALGGKPLSAPALSAAFAVHLGRKLDAPIVVTQGTLAVTGETVPGDHAWVMIGPWIADMALFTRAYAADAPPTLAAHVLRAFGPGKGLFCEAWRRTPRMGLGYDPRRVLDDASLETCLAEASAQLRAA